MDRRSLIEVRTGSDSDIPKISEAYGFFDEVGIPYSPRILSAHRTPDMMAAEAKKLADNGFRVSIAAAGGSAHLPGMTASETLVPVVAIPVRTTNLRGQDSLYSIIQMPEGIPVGCVGIGFAGSAAILAAQIAYRDNTEVRNRIRARRGLDAGLSGEIPPARLVGVIKPTTVELDEKKYDAMRTLLAEFGLRISEFEVSPSDRPVVASVCAGLEREGAVAVIALAHLSDDRTTNYFPGVVSGCTDIPTIALPLTIGFAGSNPNITGDIFHGMLCSAGPGETKGFPVAGMGINRYTNAALFAAQIAGLFDGDVLGKLKSYRETLADAVRAKDARIQNEGVRPFLK